MKEKVKQWLDQWGVVYEDVGGAYDPDDDYPDKAEAVARRVAREQENRGIVLCGSGVGVAVAANKIRGIRAGTCTMPEQAEAVVVHDHVNVLALSSDYVDEATNKKILKAFLDARYSDKNRYVNRVIKVAKLEANT